MDNLDRIRELFNAALEHDRSQRSAFLDEACGGDASLRGEVEALLETIENNPDFLARPAWASCLDQSGEKGRITEDLEPEPGLPFERLGEYRLIRKIGEGGMGVVFLAVQESLNRLVAVKAIRPERIGTFEAEARFRREVESISELRHSNIVTVFGSGEEKGVLYFAMELVPGEGLDVLLRQARERDEAIPHDRILRWTAQIADALESAHQAGVIHRDVKPSNIRITPEDRAILLDFGVARHSDLASLTLSGEFRGTPHYASPEQVTAKRKEIDERSDIYSLGVTLYEAVVGRVPFEGETTQQVFSQIMENEPASPRRINTAIHRDLETVILAAMDKIRARRYQTAAGFAGDLKRLLRSEPVTARPAGMITRSARWIRRHRFASLLAAASVLVLIAAATIVSVISAQQERELLRAEAEFVPIREALHWPNAVIRTQAWLWIIDCDSDTPCGYLLRAVHDIAFEWDAFEGAADGLKICIDKCRERGELELEQNARYLLALVNCCLAAESKDRAERDRLLERARAEFRAAIPLDPVSPECLVWQDENWQDFASGAVRPDPEEIRVNKQHHLVHLYQSAGMLSELFRGGHKRNFEEVIRHLEKVIERRPDHTAALMFMSRTYFFVARFFHFLELTDDAVRYSERAAKAAGDQTNYWVSINEAQVLLLRGDNDGALESLEKVSRTFVDKKMPGYQNVLGALGKAHARKGNHATALEHYDRALESASGEDVHVLAAKAELHLERHETDLVMNSVHKTIKVLGQMPDVPAALYAVIARAHFQKGDYARALDYLDSAWKLGEHSPRDLSVNVMFLCTFPEGFRRRAAGIASYCIRKAEDNAVLKGRLSPTCLSGLGASYLVRKSHGKAIENLEKAIEGRKAWPAVSREYYWSENARDRYFLVLAHHRLASESADKALHERKARKYYDEAEAEYGAKTPAIETAYLLDRVRAMAQETLGIGAEHKGE